MAGKTELTGSPVLADVLDLGHEFSFVQVMRVAGKILAPGGEEGISGIPWQERVRIRPNLSLAFPPSDVARVERDGAGIRVTVTFLELYGPASPLPNFFTEDLMEEASSDESVFRDFIDTFQNRLQHLYFLCWSKYRLLIRVVEDNNPVDRERLLCLIGLGEKELASTLPDPYGLLRYTGLFTQYPRSACGLLTILKDALKENRVSVLQNRKRMVRIPNDQRMRMGMSGCRLGIDTVLGSEIADLMGRFRVKIDGLRWEAYNGYLPDTTKHRMLAGLTRFYLIDPLEMELELALAAGEARPIRLGDPETRLGLNMWCFSGDTLGEVSAVFRISNGLPLHPIAECDLVPPESGRELTDHYREERKIMGDSLARLAATHPNLAPLLSGPMADPGVERLLEGSAFMNALLRCRLDDDFPEVIHPLSDALHPCDVRPIPASTIVAFSPKSITHATLLVPAGGEVASIPVRGTVCRFRTCFDVTVHPLKIVDAAYSRPSGSSPSIRLACELIGLGLSAWKPDSIRIFLSGSYPAACDLYLLLFRHLARILIQTGDNGTAIEIRPDSLKPVGFAENEKILTMEPGSFPGNGALQEYFLFRDKFLFFDLTGLEKINTLGSGTRFEITFQLDNSLPFVPEIDKGSFTLGATPAVNLFSHEAEPIWFTSELREHPISPDRDRPEQYRIYSVDKVEGLVKQTSEKVSYVTQNPALTDAENGTACRISRCKSPLGEGFDTFISIPLQKKEIRSSRVRLGIDLTCTNGTLPEQLRVGDISAVTSSIPEHVEPRNIKPVTPSLSPTTRQNRQWKLLSGLSLNSVALSSAANFRAILGLFIHANSRNQLTAVENARKIGSIEAIDARATDRLIGRRMYRGYDVTLKLRGGNFAGPGDLYLFGAVLERFLGGFVTRTCFTRLTVEEIEKKYRYEWPPRLGDREIL